jgi:hypothetical protein
VAYATAGIKTAAADCNDAWAILTVVPVAVHEKPDFIWRYARQIFLANPQFRYGLPEAPADVVFHERPHAATAGIALVAHCTSGDTCNQVAAAFKTVVPTSKPEVVCAKSPPGIDATAGAFVLDWDLIPGQDMHPSIAKTLPAEGDAVSQCVRLAACKAARDHELDGDPAVACQKKPTDFRLACAQKKTCGEVLACAGA